MVAGDTASRKRILITGGSGLVGCSLAPLLSADHDVYALHWNTNPGFPEGVIPLKADLTDAGFIKRLPAKIDCVYHLAQSPHFRDFPAKAKEIFQVNVSSTVLLLDYAKRAGCSRFIYTSSGGVYGNSESGYNEESPVQPGNNLGFYLSTKFSSEQMAGNYSALFDVIICRLFFVYGIQQKRDMLIPRLIQRISHGEDVQLSGDEGIRLNPIHVDDAAIALHKCLDVKKYNKFNIAGKEVVNMKELCNLIGKCTGKAPVFSHTTADNVHFIANIERMAECLHAPAISLEKGIKSMLNARV